MESIRILAQIRHPKIAHLTEDEINQMIDNYYKGRNTKEILIENRVNFYPSGIVKLFPPIVVEERECLYCGVKMWKNLEPKSRVFKNELYCPNCGHFDRANCVCPNCGKLKIEDLSSGKITDNVDNCQNNLKINVVDLSILERVYLGTFLRAGLSEDKKSFSIQSFSDSPVAPGVGLLNEMISILINRKIITPLFDTILDLSGLQDYSKTNDRIKKVVFSMNIKDIESKEVMESLLMPKMLSKDYQHELLGIWRNIAIEECKSYLNYSLNYVDFPYNVGDRAHVLFDLFLNHFSTAQIFGLISRCLGYTTKEFQAGKLSRISSGSYLMGVMQNQIDRALNNSWNLTKFYRPRELPESQLSKFFFNRFLNIGDLGFSRLILLENLCQ